MYTYIYLLLDRLPTFPPLIWENQSNFWVAEMYLKYTQMHHKYYEMYLSQSFIISKYSLGCCVTPAFTSPLSKNLQIWVKWHVPEVYRNVPLSFAKCTIFLLYLQKIQFGG